MVAEHRARALAWITLLAGVLWVLALAGPLFWVVLIVGITWALAPAGCVTCLRSRNVRRLLAGWPTGRLAANYLLRTATVVELHVGAIVAGRMGLQSLAAGEVCCGG